MFAFSHSHGISKKKGQNKFFLVKISKNIILLNTITNTSFSSKKPSKISNRILHKIIME